MPVAIGPKCIISIAHKWSNIYLLSNLYFYFRICMALILYVCTFWRMHNQGRFHSVNLIFLFSFFLRTFTCETMVLLSFCTKLFFTLRTPFESAFFSARLEANLLSKVYLHYGTLHVMPVLYFPCKSTNTCFV